MFYDLEWSSNVNSARFKKMLEKEIIFEFLTGLNKELDEVFGPFFFLGKKRTCIKGTLKQAKQVHMKYTNKE